MLEQPQEPTPAQGPERAPEGSQGRGASNGSDESKGVLSVQVNAVPIVAGTRATVTLFIRNPFPDDVIIESIEAPSSEPLLPRAAWTTTDDRRERASIFQPLLSKLASITVSE